MRQRVSFLFSRAALLAACFIFGQGHTASASAPQTEGRPGASNGGAKPDQWQMGVMAFAARSPFAGEGTYVRVLPALSYRGRHLFLEGLQAGYHFVPADRGPLAIDLLAALRLRPGEARKQASLDAGLRLSYRLARARLSLTVRQDVSGVHGGQEVTLGVGTRIPAGDLTLIPSVEAEWQSRKLANHQWGTSLSDHQRAAADGFGDALPAYQIAGPVLNYGASLLAVYRLDRHWRLTGLFKGRYLDSDAAANPGIIRRLELRGGLGLSYAF